MIPTTSPSVDVAGLHPLLRLRVDAMLADPRMKGYKVVSGVRTYAEQKRLYDGWVKGRPGFNLAANPDAYGAPTFDGMRFRGSRHMEQDDGYGYAVDLRAPAWHSTKKRWRLVGEVAADYGLRQVVSTEWWHLEHRDRTHIFPAPRIAVPITPPPEEEDDMSITIAYDEKARKFRVFVMGEGSTLVDNPTHWVEKIKESKKTGLPLSSPYLQDLVDKCRADR